MLVYIMRGLLFYFLIIVTVSQGVKWNDFHGGNIKLPITLKNAKAARWVLCEEDDTHGVFWYSQDNTCAFSVSFDQETGDCAGVRVVILDSYIDSDYRKLYQYSEGIFETFTFNGQKAYKSIVVFSPKGYVTNKGQDVKGVDEVAYFAFLKEAFNDKMIERKVCEQAEKSYTEQGCHPKYGLVLSNFGTDTKCKCLKPFYAIYDTVGTGDLIGFGWILFSKETKSDSIFKPLAAKDAKALFPQSPSCMTSSKTLSVAEVWLSHSTSRRVACPTTSWVDDNCVKPGQNSGSKRAVQPEQSKSFWSRWFG